ncbi:hypothetical protein KSF78_0009583 [Schistosoma japonicum]|nr:hypothetical protein KSF78_0009583 [Schistosoma japonicum]
MNIMMSEQFHPQRKLPHGASKRNQTDVNCNTNNKHTSGQKSEGNRTVTSPASSSGSVDATTDAYRRSKLSRVLNLISRSQISKVGSVYRIGRSVGDGNCVGEPELALNGFQDSSEIKHNLRLAAVYATN